MTKSAPPAAPAWSLDGSVARHAAGRIDLHAPAAGIAVAGPSGEDQLLALDLRAQASTAVLVDHWVRGDDLMAVYEPTDPRRLRATAMWRSLAGGPAAWELVVSAQTSLVESDSAVAVGCDVAAGRISWGRERHGHVAWAALEAGTACPAEATCLLVRRAADVVLVAVHPADLRRISIRHAGDRAHVACWLFSATLEKGVLLRSRVRAAVGPDGDAAWAEALVRDLAGSPPPLTT